MHKMCLSITWKFCSGKLVILIHFVPLKLCFKFLNKYSVKVLQLLAPNVGVLNRTDTKSFIVSLLIINNDVYF